MTKNFSNRNGKRFLHRLATVSLAALACQAGFAENVVPLDLFAAPEDLEVTLWAQSPMLRNPTNMDVDKDGRLWVAEGVNYRSHYDRQREGDCITVLEDSDGDGKADKSWVFVQEPFLRAPMGVAVIDNKIVVSMTPCLIVYTDVDRDMKFDPAVDKREVLLTGFNGRNHDHSLHSVTVGPDGQWYWNAGNAGALFTDVSGRTFRIGGAYDPYYGRRKAGDFNWSPLDLAGQKSDDGHVYVGGFTARMNPDGTDVHIIGYNFRNSYEQTVTSFGDVFHTDNDDPPACRTTFLMEGGNAGFFSFDGKRLWQADRRPGQSVPTAEWRQEDPGTIPAGDIYGGGSPTGVAFYEGGALGEKFRGLLLTCDAGRNVVFGYYPKPEGAGYTLEHFNFLTSNKEEEFAGSDFKGGGRSKDIKTMFRPSDVLVGADGAIYVSDWFDGRVGGHQDLDDTLSGAIYRVAPKGFKPQIPSYNLKSTAGQIAALRSPAVNVRSAGFDKLRQQGEKAVPAVMPLLKDPNPYVSARAVWLLSQLGLRGINTVEQLLNYHDPAMRTVAFRALRRQDYRVLELARKMSNDPSPMVRREVALAMRDVPAAQAVRVLVDIAKGYDGKDASYLAAFGIGCTDKEEAIYAAIVKEDGHDSDPLKWSKAQAGIAWRLHPEAATEAFRIRALAPSLPEADRKAAIVALGYTYTEEAANAMIDIAGTVKGGLRAEAVWWLLNQKDSHWKEFGVTEALKERGIYDPDKVQVVSITVPEPPKTSSLPAIEQILELKGDAARGKQFTTACITCHRIGSDGVDYAPNLTGFAQRQTSDVVLRSIINPSADISHGFDGTHVVTKDGMQIDGLVLSNGDPLIIESTGGVTQAIPANHVQSKKALGRSLMISADQMGLQAQDLADLLAYLKTVK